MLANADQVPAAANGMDVFARTPGASEPESPSEKALKFLNELKRAV